MSQCPATSHPLQHPTPSPSGWDLECSQTSRDNVTSLLVHTLWVPLIRKWPTFDGRSQKFCNVWPSMPHPTALPHSSISCALCHLSTLYMQPNPRVRDWIPTPLSSDSSTIHRIQNPLASAAIRLVWLPLLHLGYLWLPLLELIRCPNTHTNMLSQLFPLCLYVYAKPPAVPNSASSSCFPQPTTERERVTERDPAARPPPPVTCNPHDPLSKSQTPPSLS
jgi:hypothetical protein